MRILNDEKVLNYLDTENNNEPPTVRVQQIQVHLDYKCGCKITQDKKGNSLFCCDKHKNWERENSNGEILHKHIH